MPGGRVNGQTIGREMAARKRFIKNIQDGPRKRQKSTPRYKKAGRRRQKSKTKKAKGKKNQTYTFVAGRDGHTRCSVVKKASPYVKKLLRGGPSELGPTRVFTDQYDAGAMTTVANGFQSQYLIPTYNNFTNHASTPSQGGIGMFDYWERYQQMRASFNVAQVAAINTSGQYILFKSCTTTYTISNHSNIGVTLIIYDCTAKRDLYANFAFSTASAAALPSKNDPIAAWDAGMADTFISASGTGTIGDLGAKPSMSKRFTRNWHMDCTTKIHLGPNSTVKHTVHFEPNRLWRPEFDALNQTGVTGVLASAQGAIYSAGMTHVTFMRAHGDPIYEATSLDQNLGITKLLTMVQSRILSKVCTPTVRKVYARGNAAFGTIETTQLTGEAGAQEQNVAVVIPT